MYDTHLAFPEPRPVTTIQGGQGGLAFPFAPVLDTGTFVALRLSLQILCLSVTTVTGMEVSIGLQDSDDGVTWPASTATPTFPTNSVARNSEGITMGAFDPLPAGITKKYVRIVAWVKNLGANTHLGTCLASIRVERRN